jgi:hypothetical protein
MSLAVAIIGWVFLYLLNNRTLKRSEIQKLKDNAISCLETLIHETSKVFEKNKKDNNTHSNACGAELEDTITIFVTKFEFKARSLDYLCPLDIIEPTKCAEQLRNVDTEELLKSKDSMTEYHELIYEIIDNFESAYFNKYFNRSYLRKVFDLIGPRLLGAFVGALTVYMLLCVAMKMYS